MKFEKGDILQLSPKGVVYFRGQKDCLHIFGRGPAVFLSYSGSDRLYLIVESQNGWFSHGVWTAAYFEKANGPW